VGMTFYAPTIDAFDSDDLFAHWRAEDARIREDEELEIKRDAAYAAARSGDLDAVMQAWDEGLIDTDTAALALYGCNCRRCRKSDPGGCVRN
jgi:hypothetical protein